MSTDGHVHGLACHATEEVDLAVQTSKRNHLPPICVHGCSLIRLLSVQSHVMLVYFLILSMI